MLIMQISLPLVPAFIVHRLFADVQIPSEGPSTLTLALIGVGTLTLFGATRRRPVRRRRADASHTGRTTVIGMSAGTVTRKAAEDTPSRGAA